jgi:hypothetical protein
MTQTFREMPGFTTRNGHRYTSVPTSVPTKWQRWTSPATGLLCYGASDYKITREPYGDNGKHTYRLERMVGGKPVLLGRLYSLLRDAQNDAFKNARGEHVVNWA